MTYIAIEHLINLVQIPLLLLFLLPQKAVSNTSPTYLLRPIKHLVELLLALFTLAALLAHFFHVHHLLCY